MKYQNRAGAFVEQQSDYIAFIPKSLPPDPEIRIDMEMLDLLSLADRRLGRLDGVTQILPNPDLFVAMYVRKEAVLSSQIEGTQASLIDVLGENEPNDSEKIKHIEEISNYIEAMNYGLRRLEVLPISLRLIREIHSILLEGVRGSEKSLGEFRRSQNWIGPAGCSLSTATFVPPPVVEMQNAMNDLEMFFHDENNRIPPLIKTGLIHAQFETIHPFLDGNGRMGRLLITFWLCQQKILNRPLLYLSYYFKKNRTEYYDRLMDVRLRGEWENWIKFFLKRVAEVSNESTETAKKIIKMKDEHSLVINNNVRNPSNGLKLLEMLFEEPVITINRVSELLNISYPTANTLVTELCNMDVLKQINQNLRYKKFAYHKYVNLLQEGTELDPVG